jgi:hypothetical protein
LTADTNTFNAGLPTNSILKKERVEPKEKENPAEAGLPEVRLVEVP